jgi:hypothetical protein
MEKPPRLIVSWNLPRLAAGLAAHLETLRLADDLEGTYTRSGEYLGPYNLSPEDEHTVMTLAWGKQCVDCGDVRDYYMVYGHVWKEAGLAPNQCCCCRCLAARLGRPLKPGDFTYCPANTWNRRCR